MMFTRRLLLTAAAPFLLWGCGTRPVPVPPTPTPPVPTPTPVPVPPSPMPTWLDDLQSAITWVETNLHDLRIFLPTALFEKVSGYLASAKQLLGDITAAIAAGASPAALVSSAVKVLNDLVAALTKSGIALPAWATTGLTAISTLLSVILAVFGLGARRMAYSAQRVAWARAVLHQRR